MTDDISLFIDFMPKKKSFFTYGEKNKGSILVKCSVGNPSSTTISDVMLVEGLKHNLVACLTIMKIKIVCLMALGFITPICLT